MEVRGDKRERQRQKGFLAGSRIVSALPILGLTWPAGAASLLEFPLRRAGKMACSPSPVMNGAVTRLFLLFRNSNNLTELDPRTSKSMPMLQHVELNQNRLTSLDSAWFKKGNQIKFL